MRKTIQLLLPFLAFILYLHTMGPTIVPYRDAGEMATTVTRLGVLHAPGYPLYTLIGHLFTRIPLANPAYLLNLLSALSLAIAWAILLVLACELWGTIAGAFAIALGIISFQFWIHALVSEMYTLNLVFLAGILFLLHRRKFYAAAFALGLGLGARMDLILCVPAFLVLFWRLTAPEERFPYAKKGILFFFAGFSVFLYLWVRANGQPLLNWADPSTFERFWHVLTRKSYGGTLDLLSQSYKTGENFWPEFQLYARHLGRDFSLLSFPLVGLGLAQLWKNQRTWFWTILAGWVMTGPLFIFLGNLPINPHAVAIMEAAYLVPDVFYVLWIAAGFAFLASRLVFFVPVLGLVAILIVAQAVRFYPAVNKRNNWVGMDFIHNVYYSVPEPSLIAAHSDVPIFLLFYGHWVYPGFKWRVPLAQGLSASAWYQVMMNSQTPKLDAQPLWTAADWETTVKANPGWSVYGTLDLEWPPELYSRMVPNGVLMHFQPQGKASVIASDVFLSDMNIYRGHYRYDAYQDFFTPEVIEEYAKAWMEWGRLLVQSHHADEAIDAYLHALSLKPDVPYAAFQLGYIYFSKNDFNRADYYYDWAVDNFRQLHQQSLAWKSFAEIRQGIYRDEAQAISHWGVIQERKGNPDRAVALYRRALEIDPGSADARYNLAVIYWRAQRWPEVIEHLQALSASHPEDPRWRIYLPKALEKMKK